MVASVNSPSDVVNIALGVIGYPGRVGNLYDGSDAANKALDLYSQTRDAILRESDWGFAERINALAVATQAAPAPWSFQYIYPEDCIRIRNIFNADYLADKNNPVPVLYTVAQNAVDGKTVLANLGAATLVYTAQITDMARWEPLFVEAVVAALARRLSPSLASGQIKFDAQQEAAAVGQAAGVVG